ncbi:hypothetical protein LguiB_020448 [Lonicera macranthoides]
MVAAAAVGKSGYGGGRNGVVVAGQWGDKEQGDHHDVAEGDVSHAPAMHSRYPRGYKKPSHIKRDCPALEATSSKGSINDCASNGNVSLIEDGDVPIPPWTFLIPDQDGDPMTINIPSDVNMNNMQIPEHVRFVSVEKVSTLLRMIVGLQNILVSKMLESRDRLNASNVVIHELRRRIPGRLAVAKGLDVPPCYGSLPSEPGAALG